MIIHADRRKAGRRLWIALAAGGVGLILAVLSGGDLGLMLFGLTIAVIFGGMALIEQNQASAQGPQLVIDETGVFDHRITDRVIPWSEIFGLEIASVKGQPYIYLDVGPEPLRFTDQPAKRSILSLNQWPKRGVIINPHGLDATYEQIWAELDRRLQARR